jgi:hypothetical protein
LNEKNKIEYNNQETITQQNQKINQQIEEIVGLKANLESITNEIQNLQQKNKESEQLINDLRNQLAESESR